MLGFLAFGVLIFVAVMSVGGPGAGAGGTVSERALFYLALTFGRLWFLFIIIGVALILVGAFSKKTK